MNAPKNKEEIIEGKRYSTATAPVIAGNYYWDGSNWERNRRNSFLYRTPEGAFFIERAGRYRTDQ